MDKDAFIARITSGRSKWLVLARSMLPERDCEDALQSAILSAWEHLGQLRDEKAFDAWFKQILINRCRQMQRGYKREKDMLHALSTDAGAQAEPNVYEALNGLPAQEQNLLRLHHEQGYSLKEMSRATGQSEDVLKMRLYRARKRLKVALITLLLLLLLAAAAIGSGLIDVNWFLQNRWAQPVDVLPSTTSALRAGSYSGKALAFEARDARWNGQSLSLVYSIAGNEAESLFVYAGNLGVDGVRFDHIWIDGEILPLKQWANGRVVKVFSLENWTLGDRYLPGTQDALSEGKGETFYEELRLDSLTPEQYAILLDENGHLELTATLTLKDGSTVLESGTARLLIDAPSAEEWRELYEASHP